jgi:hypothetical protein
MSRLSLQQLLTPDNSLAILHGDEGRVARSNRSVMRDIEQYVQQWNCKTMSTGHAALKLAHDMHG